VSPAQPSERFRDDGKKSTEWGKGNKQNSFNKKKNGTVRKQRTRKKKARELTCREGDPERREAICRGPRGF